MTIFELIKVTEMYATICIFKNGTHEHIFSGTTNTLYELCYKDLRGKKIMFLKVIDSSLIVYI